MSTEFRASQLIRRASVLLLATRCLLLRRLACGDHLSIGGTGKGVSALILVCSGATAAGFSKAVKVYQSGGSMSKKNGESELIWSLEEVVRIRVHLCQGSGLGAL
jgi:hypothetical protein